MRALRQRPRCARALAPGWRSASCNFWEARPAFLYQVCELHSLPFTSCHQLLLFRCACGKKVGGFPFKLHITCRWTSAGDLAARSSRSKLKENSAGSAASRWRIALPGVRGVMGSSMMLLSCESVPSDDRDDDLAVSTDSEKKLCSRFVLLGLASSSHWHAAGDCIKAFKLQRQSPTNCKFRPIKSNFRYRN